MEFRVSFKQMESSDDVKDYARQKLSEKITKYVKDPIEVHVIISRENNHKHVQCNVFAGEGFTVQVSNEEEELFACLDKLADKLDARMNHQKGRLEARKLKRGSRERIAEVAQQEGLEHEDSIDARDLLAYEAARLERDFGERRTMH